MILNAIKKELGRRVAPNTAFDRKAVSRYLLSLASARVDYIPLQSREEDFVQVIMNLPYEDVVEKRMFCQDLGLLIGDNRFPVVWRVQHLKVLLQLQRRRQPADDLACLCIPMVLERGAGFSAYPILTELVEELDDVPASSVQWLILLQMLCREVSTLDIAQVVNSGLFFRLNGAQLQQLSSLRIDQQQGLNGVLSALGKLAPWEANLLLFLIRRMDDRGPGFSDKPPMLSHFIREVLPTAEARVNEFGLSFIPGSNGQFAEQIYERVFGLYQYWLLHKEGAAPWLDPVHNKLMGQVLSGETYRNFTRLSFRKVVAYLPVRWLWNLPALLGRRLDVLVHLGAGKNIRTFEGLKLPVSKRMAHLFHNLPPGDELSVHTLNTALRYAYWQSLAGEEWLLQLMPHFQWLPGRFHYLYRRHQKHFPDWEKALKRLVFLAKNDPAFMQLPNGELYRLFAYCRYLIGDGQVHTLKGSTLASLQRRTEAWYQANRLRQMARLSKEGADSGKWIGAPYEELLLEVEGNTYRIVQVTSLDDLFEEAEFLRHCVWQYQPKCTKGTCSIWSLRKYEADAMTRLVTIEVNKAGRIVQARRKYNACPNALQLDLIERWAEEAGLEFRRKGRG